MVKVELGESGVGKMDAQGLECMYKLIMNENQQFHLLLEKAFWSGTVARVYNPRGSGCRDWEDRFSRPVWGKSWQSISWVGSHPPVKPAMGHHGPGWP